MPDGHRAFRFHRDGPSDPGQPGLHATRRLYELPYRVSMKRMSTFLSHIVIFGLPLALWFGVATFICLFTTALLGVLVLKGRYNIPFAWHMRMAALTLAFAVIHVILVMLLFFF